MQIWPGTSYPLGATFDGSGTNFAIFSNLAERVVLCLIDDNGAETQIELTEQDAHVWHCYLPGVQPGTRYGYRVHGEYAPEKGYRFDPSKLLLDPYAKAIDGQIDGDPSLYSYQFGDPSKRNQDDSAGHGMLAVVINPFFDWGHDRPPRHEYHDTIIYETHVKGMSALHPDVPEELRGTYAGMAHPAVIEHLVELGVTAVELMPVHQFVDDPNLRERNLHNYWGYNTIGFFAPHNGYAAYGSRGQQVQEFKALVKAMHEADIEVILDVVYNHTAEGNHLGPTLSFRGIDNPAYYRLVDEDPSHYFDTTGTGNSLLMRSPAVLQLIMDSLRYWVEDMHVDGFRFDLASTLARQFHEVDRLAVFFELVHQDPVISQVKLIAEPWDLGDGGYQVGNFPPLWSEWNGKYRDTVRDFWRGEPSTLAEFARRLTGSADLYEHSGRRPVASINFVTAHDGFTLADLVSYNEKRNDANGENNMDGESHNRSWNCGCEGPTTDQRIKDLRARQQRNFLATLLGSQGVPMISHGDEMGRTQQGNNNTYCQDTPLSWIDWDLSPEDAQLLKFTTDLIALRKNHPVFRRRRFFAGQPGKGDINQDDLEWLTPSAQTMLDRDWSTTYARSIMVYLNGDAIPEPDSRGQKIHDDSFLILFNAAEDAIEFSIPDKEPGKSWEIVLNTEAPDAVGEVIDPGSMLTVQSRSVIYLRSLIPSEVSDETPLPKEPTGEVPPAPEMRQSR
ncbi:glycogen debranching protein GlgX [Bowdeniella nasicola]|uniref:glycogen debranching protein GlgX n=1 Tax=Bowdeniella nasicola TaxID=208480 RepID=UPI0009FB0EE6|nr:glycogen debranching protein GlgX [Bowdeniella nasicola]